MSSDDVVIARDLTKRYVLYKTPSERLMHMFMPKRVYPHFDALKGISFSLKRGETVGIIGRNGAGKSTLLQLVTGISPPTSGTLQVSGRVAALLELGAGFEPDFTGRENIVLNGTILGLSGDQLKARMDEIIAFSELGEFIDRPVRTYSTGMFMRLAFSVAAHVDADLLIIDEALSVGDTRFMQKCMRFLHAFKARGSILFVSHDLGSVTALCDRAIWLDQGVVRAEGTPVRVCEQYVAALFDGKDTTAEPAAVEQPRKAVRTDGDITVLYDANQASIETLTTCSDFNPDASAFGSGGAKVVDAGVFDPIDGHRLDKVSEGQEIDLRIVVSAEVRVERPIFGFYIKDRLGQLLMGDNTYRDHYAQVPIEAGDRGAARFRFKWPALVRGGYSLTVAIADGTMADHIQRHWIHDAVLFDVLATSANTSLVGLNFSEVAVERLR